MTHQQERALPPRTLEARAMAAKSSTSPSVGSLCPPSAPTSPPADLLPPAGAAASRGETFGSASGEDSCDRSAAFSCGLCTATDPATKGCGAEPSSGRSQPHTPQRIQTPNSQRLIISQLTCRTSMRGYSVTFRLEGQLAIRPPDSPEPTRHRSRFSAANAGRSRQSPPARPASQPSARSSRLAPSSAGRPPALFRWNAPPP